MSAHEAHAVEVAAMLGDSVVEVKHCIDPKAGTITPRTWGLFAAGVACVLASGAAFYASVMAAAHNQAGLAYWTHVLHKPAYAYRGQQLSIGYDWLAFGGFVAGLVALAAGLVRMRRERVSPYFRIGTAPGVELPVDGAPSPDFPLVAPHGDGFVFHVAPGITGELVAHGRSTPLAELAAAGSARASIDVPGAFAIPIEEGAKIRARAGGATFLVSAVPAPRRQVTPLLAGLESRTMAYFAGSLAVHLGIWALLQTIPEETGGASIDLASIEEVNIHSDGTQKTDPPPPELQDDSGGGGSTGQGTAMALEAGAAGDPKAATTHHHIAIKNTGHDIQLARQQAIEEARTAGILGTMSALSGGFASLEATADASSGFDAVNAYGEIYGADAGDSNGSFGFARGGFGRGGGCGEPPCGIIGTGRYGTIGTGAHAGDGWGGPGGFGPGGRKHHAGVPTPIVGEPIATGDLDRAIIRRYIKRNLSKIAYCYEKQLLVSHGLVGTINVSFMILGNGGVKGATGTGFDATIASCVAEVVGDIQFPAPTNGGTVQVNYPFNFHASGQ